MCGGQAGARSLLTGIEAWQEAGVPDPVILRAMTTDAIRLLGLEKMRGALKPGLAADLIATKGNPLKDIRTLQHVVFVMKNGEVMKHAP
jgi:imidazolonepropionase-like amidohydrolase